MSTRLNSVLTAVAIAAVAGPAWVVSHPPAIPKHRSNLTKVAHIARVVPPAEVPPVGPVSFIDLTPDEARAFNEAVPFVRGPRPPARPFRLDGSEEDRARAIDCMAAAVLYEAGDDPAGERAVAQVVLNRLRHPAFPKTVCGVVFEGEARRTGCQFSFTCDGAVARWTPPAGAWERARTIATRALTGAVYGPVGLATHYHTDWVVPYWQASLDKIAQVGTHLFFRWTGWWGTPAAFDRRATGGEPPIAQLAAISDAHKIGAALAEAQAASAEGAALAALGPAGAAVGGPKPLAGDPDSFAVALDPAAAPDSYPAIVPKLCGDRSRCIVMAWTDPRRVPTARPLTDEQMAAMRFSYLRDRGAAIERTLWNCDGLPRPDAGRCMKRSAPGPVPAASPTPVAKAAEAGAATAVPELSGVRRRGPGGPVPAPTPIPTATPVADARRG